MTLSKFGFNSEHLKRMVQNMRHLVPTMESMLQVEEPLKPLATSGQGIKADSKMKETTNRKVVQDVETSVAKKEMRLGLRSTVPSKNDKAITSRR